MGTRLCCHSSWTINVPESDCIHGLIITSYCSRSPYWINMSSEANSLPSYFRLLESAVYFNVNNLLFGFRLTFNY